MLALTAGCIFSDRIEALLDGRVAPAGCSLGIQCVEAQKLFNLTLKEQAFDIAELSMGSHIASVAAGRRDYAAIPVFLSRSFRHSNLYIRTDRRIDHPADLAGKSIGLVDYQQTAALWLRGLLADRYGVARHAIDWVTGGLHAPVLTDRMTTDMPPGIRVNRSSETLDDLLTRGAIDAVISPTAPRCFTANVAPVDRLWPDYRREEEAFWRDTALFPIMHVLVVRRSLIEAHPWLARNLYQAFAAARDLAIADLAARDFPKVAMPWLSHAFGQARDVLGGDIWTYGLDANRDVLETMLRYAEADGLTGGGIAPDDLFAPMTGTS